MKSIMLMASPPFHKIPIKGFYVSQGPTAYRYGDTIKILTYLRYSINRLQYKTEHILKEIKAVLGFDILHRFYIPPTKHFTFP